MKILLLAALLPVLAASAAPAKKPVLALLPVKADTAEHGNLLLLVEARAAQLIEASGAATQLHLKQVLAMAEQEGLALDALADDATADQARVLLGADRVVALSVTADGKGLAVKGSIRDGKKPVAVSFTMPATWSEGLAQGSEALAKAVLAVDKVALPAVKGVQPDSKSEAALQALGECYAVAIRQSVSLDSPVTLNGEDLDHATESCAKALGADATLRFARATLALMQAIGGDDKGAVKTLAGMTDAADAALDPYVLARFWLITRYQTNQAGLSYLEETLKKRPGSLLLRAYVGDTLSLLGQNAKAVTAWTEYAAAAPLSSYAQGRLSRELSKTGKTEPALAAAKKGLELAPASREARLQLASRLIDAKKVPEAIETLKPLTESKSASPEQVLRLGWAYWLSGDADAAAMSFQAAADKASGPSAWRTRGRAFYNLALAEMKQGQPEEAKKAYRQSLATGFKMKQPDPSLVEVAKAAAAPEAKADPKAPAKAEPAKLRESSLFPDDGNGAVSVDAPKASAPDGWLPYQPTLK